MGVQIRTFDNIVADMIETIQRNLPDITVQPGSVVRELFINAPAVQFDLLYQAVQSVQAVQTLAVASGIDLDNLGANYNVTRRTAIAAQGTLLLVLEDLSTGNDITILNGSVVDAEGVGFRVVGEYIFRSVNRSIYQTIALQNQAVLESLGITGAQYVASVSITAMLAGSTGNISTGRITGGTIAGVVQFVNAAPTTGGTDAEIDEALRERIALRISGNAVGTEDGLISTALQTPGVLEAIIVGPGHMLMDRDGTVRDADGTLVTEGTGLAADIYIRGQLLETATENVTYEDHSVESDDYGPISATNDIVLGQTGITEAERFAYQPVNEVTVFAGSQSGANFAAAEEVTDDEGNIVLEGNYLLLRDYEANQYALVRNVETNTLHIARSLASSSTRYVELERFEIGKEANSGLSRDRIKWTSSVAKINDEVITRGVEFNGADTLAFSDVDTINDVVEEVLVTREVMVIEADAGFTIYARHTPIKEVQEVRHSRLGTTYAFELTNSATGEIKLIGRFPPQQDDIIQITYIWEKHYLNTIEYNLQGDVVDWIEPFNELPSQTTSILLPTQSLQAANNLAMQPNTPTYLNVTLADLVARTVYKVEIVGDTARHITDENSTYLETRAGASATDSIFAFQVHSLPKDETKGAQVGRVLRITNLTTGTEYSLLDYALHTNQYDSTARVNTELASNEFGLNELANTTVIEPGDQIQFSQLTQVQTWTTQTHLLNNINGNTAPVYDPTRIQATTDGELQLILREQDSSLTPVETSGTLLVDTIWSGLIDVVDDVTVAPGITLTVAANAIVRFKPTSAFPSTTESEDKFVISDSLTDSDPLDEYYYMFEHSVLTSSFFTIVTGMGEDYSIFFADIIRKVVTPGPTVYYRNDILIPSEFYPALEAAIAGTGDPELTSIFIGGYDQGSSTVYTTQSTLGSETLYRVRLASIPVVTGVISQDFTVFETSTPSNTVTSFNFINESNLLVLDVSVAENAYTTQYNTPHTKRIGLIVNGALVIDTAATEDTAPIFTSAASVPRSGDWEGILLNPSSVDSVLRYMRLKFANIGIRIVESSAIVDQCIVRDCLTNHISVTGLALAKAGVTGFTLTNSGFQNGMSRWLLSDKLTSFDGNMPAFETITGKDRLIAHFVWSQDYTIYADNIPIDSSLTEGQDFAIEYDINGYNVVFYDTSATQALAATTPNIKIDYHTILENGSVTNCILLESGVSSIALSKANIELVNNTIEMPGSFGLEVQNSYGLVKNSLITNYSVAPLTQDPNSIFDVLHNNMWSFLQESRELLRFADDDQLTSATDENDEVLAVLTSDKFASGQVLQVDDEFMLVRSVVPGFVSVTRGYNRSIAAEHLVDAEILIYRARVTFTVMGVPSSSVMLHRTDANGTIRTDITPLSLRALDSSTYTASFAVDRRISFSFVLTFEDERFTQDIETRVYNLSSVEFERNMNIVYNPHHILVNSDVTNFSTDPSYVAPDFDDLSVDSASLAHKSNTLFATPYNPLITYNRFIGTESVTQTETLAYGATTIELDEVPVSTVSLSTDINVVNTTDPSKVIIPNANSYNSEAGTVGIPIVNQVYTGSYTVTYNKAVTLGSSLAPYNEISSIVYIFDAEKIVDFTRLLFDQAAGGNILFRFRVGETEEALASAAFSEEISISPTSLLVEGSFARGRYIELEITLQGNDGSMSDGIYQYPILESFTLEITPARDTQFYNILTASFRQRTGITSVDIELVDSDGQGISAETITIVGSQSVLNVFVRKAGSTTEDPFLVARSNALTAGAQTIELFGDVTTSKVAPSASDILSVEYLFADMGDSEELTFVQNGVQLTTQRFFSVQGFKKTVERDRLPVALGEETIGVRSTNQPERDVFYSVDYEFEAPKEGELLTVGFNYNALVRQTSLNADANSDIVTDVLVRQAFEIPLNIEANVVVLEGADQNQLRINMNNTLETYISGLSMGTLITSSMITSILRIAGVVDLTLTRLAREDGSGVNQIQLLDRETPLLRSEDFVMTMFVYGSPQVTSLNT